MDVKHGLADGTGEELAEVDAVSGAERNLGPKGSGEALPRTVKRLGALVVTQSAQPTTGFQKVYA